MMRKHLTAAFIFVALTLILTNPMLLHLWNAVEDKQDGLLNTWIVAWVGHALITSPLNLYNTNIFYPYPNTLAFSEILLPPALVALPLTLATNNPIFGYNLSLLAMLWLDAFAMYLFVCDLTHRQEAGWIAGAVYAFNPFNLGNFAQMQLLTLGFLPLSLLFLGKLLNDGSSKFPDAIIEKTSKLSIAKFGFLFALFFVLQSLSSFYYALLAGMAVGLYLLCWLISKRADLLNSLRRVLVPLVASFALIAIVLIPFLLPYFQVQKDLGFSRTVQESEPFSASLKQFTEVSPQNVVYGQFLSPNPVKRVGGYPLDNLFPGLLAVLLVLVGISGARARAKSFLLLLLPVSFILALGPRLYLTTWQATDITLPYRWLYDIFPPLRALRAPVRFDALINFALAALAGLGASELFVRIAARQPSGSKTVSGIAIIVIALIALEYLALPAANTATLPVANEIPDVYKWLAQQPPGVVLELPMMGPNAQKELDISTQYFSTYHWQQTPDGYSGFIPPRRGEVAYEMQSWPSVRSLGLARALGVKYLIDYTPVAECYDFFGGPPEFIHPTALPEFKHPCIYEIPSTPLDPSHLSAHLYVPSTVASGAPFQAFIILGNSEANAFAVKPTDLAQFQIKWDDGSAEQVSVPMPLVTNPVSIIPIPLTAPSRLGKANLELSTEGELLGKFDLSTKVTVTNELATEIVIPASVELSEPLKSGYARGDTIQAALRWETLNKINAYYSASVRLVNADGIKVANVDRQPAQETLLWTPNTTIRDIFQLQIPPDISPGTYRVELIMYQANTDTGALLLDKDFVPQQSILLGEIQVK